MSLYYYAHAQGQCLPGGEGCTCVYFNLDYLPSCYTNLYSFYTNFPVCFQSYLYKIKISLTLIINIKFSCPHHLQNAGKTPLEDIHILSPCFLSTFMTLVMAKHLPCLYLSYTKILYRLYP